MAEVTGFTADRMRIIENTTVVDGEVQGDNLILLTREGTPIDAGNVRGPQGDIGPEGGVTHVNDQTGAIYTPRSFPTKAALDGWTTAPNGAHAWCVDTESDWIKTDGVWYLNPAARIMATKAILDAGWAPTTAPEGAQAHTLDTRSLWLKDGSGWVQNTPPRVFQTYSDRNARWPNAPRGAQAIVLENDTAVYKGSAGWMYNNGLRVFGSTAERDQQWPTPPDGAICAAPIGIFWRWGGGKWSLQSSMSGYVGYYEAEYTSAYIDTAITWVVSDSFYMAVPSVAKISVNVGTSGWAAGITPALDIYSNEIGDNWQSGYGFGYSWASGRPFDAGNVPPYYIPQKFPMTGAIETLPPGAGINWQVRCSVHNAAGAIAWNGFIHACVERYPINNNQGS